VRRLAAAFESAGKPAHSEGSRWKTPAAIGKRPTALLFSAGLIHRRFFAIFLGGRAREFLRKVCGKIVYINVCENNVQIMWKRG